MTDIRLVAEGLAVERGGRRVFDGLAFALDAGSALLVRGPNGVGKSSLLRTIAGLVPPAAGTIRLEGGDGDQPVGSQCHYFGHADGLKSALSVAENLAFWRDFGAAPKATVGEALDIVGLGHIDHLPAAYLSAGQRRRLSLARLLVTERPVWLLDEPTSALDAASEERLVAIMRDHLAGGGLIVAATHSDVPLSPSQELWMRPAGEVAA